MDASPVEARGLVKRYGRITAVDHVDLTVQAGDIYGYLGPNGAGKTTSLRILLGLIRPTAGSVRLFGRDPIADGAKALRGVAGFVEAPRFYPYLSARKNLELCAALDGGDAAGRIDSVLETVELADRADERVGGYSHGMQQRLGIASALLRDPRLLLLDEPTTGLDPGGMRDMHSLVRSLAASGITIVLSSHLLAEVEQLCNRVAIIGSGTIVYEGELSELKRSAAGRYRLRTTDNRRALSVCDRHPGVSDLRGTDGELEFACDEKTAGELSVALVEAQIAITALMPQGPTLEQLFFRLLEAAPDGSRSVELSGEKSR